MSKCPPPLPPVPPRILALSDPGYKVLRQLKGGCAYRVHGAWRFRGSHSPANNATLVNLVTKGLAEVVDSGGHTQIRITLAGSSVKKPAPTPEGADG